jgi:hypothetical protein
MANRPETAPDGRLRYGIHEEQYHGRNRQLVEGDPREILALDALYVSLAMDGTSNNWRDNENEAGTTTTTTSICDYTGIECKDNRVSVLDLTTFGLTGIIPTEIGDLSKLERLGLGNNQLHGSLPTTLQTLTNLQHLEVFRNDLTGPILEDWTLMGNLKRLLIQSNRITGTIDDSLCLLTNLKGLDLFDNPLTGSLPSCLGSNTNKLSNLRLHDTLLTGSIPDALCVRPTLNGLSPNTFGCDAIACPVGMFLLPLGRQTHVEAPCQPCPMATSLGSTTCPTALPTIELSTVPSATPTTKEPTLAPTIAIVAEPSMSPSMISSVHPSSMPSIKDSTEPSAAPSKDDQGSQPSLSPSILPTSSVALDSVTSSNDEFPGTFSPKQAWATGSPSTRLPLDTTSPTSSPTSAPSTSLAPTVLPQDVVTNRNNVVPAGSSRHPANWTLLTVACILSVLAMATVVLARRMGRKWWYAKHRRTVAPAFSTSEDDVSMESDSGWNDTESSVSSYHWADADGESAHEEEEVIEPWSVSLPETASSTTSGSVSPEGYW